MDIGIRVSLYNAIEEQEVDKFVAYAEKFIEEENAAKTAA